MVGRTGTTITPETLDERTNWMIGAYGKKAGTWLIRMSRTLC